MDFIIHFAKTSLHFLLPVVDFLPTKTRKKAINSYC